MTRKNVYSQFQKGFQAHKKNILPLVSNIRKKKKLTLVKKVVFFIGRRLVRIT